jgi:LuxR family transcriptional regulator, maltose regulon positive regulatory protein
MSMGRASSAPPSVTGDAGPTAGAAQRSTVPAPLGRLLPRPRLDARIRQGASGRLLLVTGSGGEGKTTAVAEALRGRPFVWLTVNELDRSPSTLQDRLLRALDVSGHEPDMTTPSDDRDDPIGPLVQRLARLDGEVTLVLDDRVDALGGASAGLVAQLLDRSSKELHIVLISRRRPALEIEQRRARGEVAEIRDAELAFTSDEAVSYLNHVWSLALPNEAVQKHVALTGGWPVALHLIASHLADSRDRGETTPPGTATAERATAGLVHELLESVGSADRRFLSDIAILDGLDPATTERFTGHENASEALERLAAAGLLQPHEVDYQSYRHRELVRRHLLKDMQMRFPGRERGLHQVAAARFASTGSWPTAIDHAIAAGEDRQALDWIEARFDALVAVDAGAWLKTVVASLGPSKIVTRPRLVDAWLDVAMLRGDRTALERLLTALEAATPELEGRVHATRRARSYLSRLRGDGVEPLLVHRGRRPLDPEVAHPMGMALAAEGRHDAASAALRRALDEARLRREPFRELSILGDAAWQQAIAGYLVDADVLTRRAAELASTLGADSPPLTAVLAGAQISLDRGRIEAARSQASTVHAVAQDTCDLVLRTDAGMFVSRARWAQGDLEGAVRALARTERELGDHVPGGGLLSRFARARASMCLALDDPDGAISALPAIMGDLGSLPPEDRLVAASVHLKLGAIDRAQAAIESLQDEGIGPRLTVHALRVEAAAVGLRGDFGEATRLRRQADRIARVRGLLTPMHHRRVPRAEPELAERSDVGPIPVEAGPAIDNVEELTHREIEVLRLLHSATNDEIARDLYVSVNTVKTHLKSIYRKLDVTSRDAAVRRARVVGAV